MESQFIDHLFRHHYGKMVSVLIRIFGVAHLETIEDAVQDTFITATLSWKTATPDQPEAWLTKAAKNRVLDIFRKLKAEKKRVPQFENGIDAIAISELFLESEIDDSQLRMIFTACHPNLSPQDRIAISLKTVSGFSITEIASALLTKDETVKKRLTRARKIIAAKNLSFTIPQGKELPIRLESVLEVLYLVFNEGFHSNKKDILVRKDLCGEAMRLCQLVLKNQHTRSTEVYALFALMCFHSARLDSKTNANNEILDLKTQDRSTWHYPLVELGNTMMNKAVDECAAFSCYHYEAAIAAEHLKAVHFENTDWDKILLWYKNLNELQPMPIHTLTMAVIEIQRSNLKDARKLLDSLQPSNLGQRAYLYHGTEAEYFELKGDQSKALNALNLALQVVNNEAERKHLEKKKALLN